MHEYKMTLLFILLNVIKNVCTTCIFTVQLSGVLSHENNLNGMENNVLI
jgi:hypothetical protein